MHAESREITQLGGYEKRLDYEKKQKAWMLYDSFQNFMNLIYYNMQMRFSAPQDGRDALQRD